MILTTFAVYTNQHLLISHL